MSQGRGEQWHAKRHVSMPKSFADGDVREWLRRFNICSKADNWNTVTQALKLRQIRKGKPWQSGWNW